MCGIHESALPPGKRGLVTGPAREVFQGNSTRFADIDTLMPMARFLSTQEEIRRSAVGFIGYGATHPGDRVLIVVDSLYDPRVPEAIARGLRERGARVDLAVADIGPDRVFDELDEIRVSMRSGPWQEDPRRWDYMPWVAELGHRRKYDLIIHGKGGPIPQTPFRYEAVPWLQVEHLASPATTFPRELHNLINEKCWDVFYKFGQGGRVHLTDPEGTDLTYTLWPEYFDDRIAYTRTPVWGHIMGHAPTPIISKEDATGVVAGTTSHFSRAFPRIELELDHGLVTAVRGGGGYGQAWGDLKDRTDQIQYPCFPRPGLFWLWEVAIGTHPKIVRPSHTYLHSSGGFEWERRRSGIIHLGFGTFWCAEEEYWAAERGLTFGHLHVHLLYPTLDVTAPSGQTLRVVDHGRLTALDDPAVRRLAARYGNPDEVLREDWQPQIPGISVAGSYAEYARDPATYVYGGENLR